MTKGDKFLIFSIILISIISLGIIKSKAIDEDKYISIQVNGREYKRVIFDKAIIGKNIEIKTEFGYNLIEIGDGEVKVIDADCPDKLDVKQGSISKVGEIIVCLPNRMVIELKGIDNNREIDYMSR